MRSKRRDGVERKALLLEAATKVFAEKGYRDTTVADICAEAKSNTASVSYYYGSKEALYAEVWRTAFGKAMTTYPLDMGVSAVSTPQEQLKAFIRSMLYKMLAGGQLGSAGQILLSELSNPTDILDCVKHDTIEPIRLHVRGILCQILGPQASEREIAFCALSIVHQCMGFGFKKGHLPPVFQTFDQPEVLEMLVEHVSRFSLAGLAAIKEQIRQR